MQSRCCKSTTSTSFFSTSRCRAWTAISSQRTYATTRDLKHLPIIMITSRSGEKHRAKAIEIGVNDYLSKPYQEAQLIKAIESLVGRPLMSADPKELYSLLIPLACRATARAANVRRRGHCVRRDASAAGTRMHPNGMLGTSTGTVAHLPVVSFDRGEPAPSNKGEAKPSRARIVVFHALTNRLKGGYYGILTQGFPQLVRVNADVVALDTEYAVAQDLPVLCRVADDPRISADPRRRTARGDDRGGAVLLSVSVDETSPQHVRECASRDRGRFGAQHLAARAPRARTAPRRSPPVGRAESAFGPTARRGRCRSRLAQRERRLAARARIVRRRRQALERRGQAPRAPRFAAAGGARIARRRFARLRQCSTRRSRARHRA